jgi:hypothetical protein
MRKPTPEISSHRRRQYAAQVGHGRGAADSHRRRNRHEEATPAWIGAGAEISGTSRSSWPRSCRSWRPFRRAFSGRLVEVTGDFRLRLGFALSIIPNPEIGADRLAAAVAAHADGDAGPRSSSLAARRPLSPCSTRRDGSAAASSRPVCRRNWPRLLGATAQLPATTLAPARSALARSTQDAIRAGVMLEFPGRGEGNSPSVERIAAGPAPHIILTGGNARLPRRKSRLPAKAAAFTRLRGSAHDWRSHPSRFHEPNPTSENRIDRKFRELKARGQKAFVAYITAGDPTPETDARPGLGAGTRRGGHRRTGRSFSDPLADGVVNQLSAQRALEAGTTTPPRA